MSNGSNNSRTWLAVSSGEPAGIGPDICLSLADWPPADQVRPVVLGNLALLTERRDALGLSMTLRAFNPHHEPVPHTLEVIDFPLPAPVQAGQLNPCNASYVLAMLDFAVAGCRSGQFHALVTAPVHKEVINDSGLPFTGHTEYLAQKTATEQVVMMLAGQQDNGQGMLRVALVTTHMPLQAVSAAITRERLHAVLAVLREGLIRDYGLPNPRIAVSGLNPHAGEGGYLGREEIDIIEPVLAECVAAGWALSGPYPADTLFTPPILSGVDAVLAMYHDQGLAVLKYATFGRGVNITLGLPIIRTSVDHGTALSLAGTGQAKCGSLWAAVEEARHMVHMRGLGRLSEGSAKKNQDKQDNQDMQEHDGLPQPAGSIEKS